MISALFLSETVAPVRSSQLVWAYLGALMLSPKTALEIPRATEGETWAPADLEKENVKSCQRCTRSYCQRFSVLLH
jgi:hypothetical protein